MIGPRQPDTQSKHKAMSAEQAILKKVRGCKLSVLYKDDEVHPKYVNAIRNSALARWCLSHGETIPNLSAAKQRPLVSLVDRILAAKSADPSADTSELEDEIDWLVYDLYGLANEETGVVADFFWDGTLTKMELRGW